MAEEPGYEVLHEGDYGMEDAMSVSSRTPSFVDDEDAACKKRKIEEDTYVDTICHEIHECAKEEQQPSDKEVRWKIPEPSFRILTLPNYLLM